MKQLLSILISISILTGCSSYETIVSDVDNTGDISVRINSPMQSVDIRINEEPEFQENNVKNVLLNNVPAGEISIHVRGGASNRVGPLDYREDFVLNENELYQIYVTAPGFTTGYYLMNGVIMLGTVGLSLWLIN